MLFLNLVPSHIYYISLLAAHSHGNNPVTPATRVQQSGHVYHLISRIIALHGAGLNVADKVPGPGCHLAVARPRIIINCAPASDNDIYTAKMQIVI